MISTEERLYNLLPAIHRIRDAERGGPLKALIAVIAEQVAVIEEDLDQLYDDQFIETCAPWVAPYLGDLIGYQPLHGVVPRVSSPRAEIANTIGYRRRKGTAAMLEQVARDVTGWHARVVEFFQRLAGTQHMNHVRLGSTSTDVRRWEPLERLGTPFDTLAHTVDVRRIAAARGRYNIPNIGVFLWRLNSHRLNEVDAYRLDARRYHFNPLGIDGPLFTRPEPKKEFSGLSSRMHVPDPISRRVLGEYLADYYGEGKSLLLQRDGRDVQADEIAAGDLSDADGGMWAHQPTEKIVIDPVLGRIAFPSGQLPPEAVRVMFHHGFSAEMGAGDYDRSASVPLEFTAKNVWQIGVSGRQAAVPGEVVATLEEAVFAWNALPPGAVGVIAVMDGGTYRGDVSIALAEGSRLFIVAAEWPETFQDDMSRRRIAGRFTASGIRPHVSGHIAVQSTGGGGGELVLNGLLVEGNFAVNGNAMGRVSLNHCTLVPGRGFSREGYPIAPRDPSVVVATPRTRLRVDRCIVGGLRVAETVTTHITDSIVDATSRCGVAFAALDGYAAGGTLRFENTTVVGKVHTAFMELATNSIFYAHLAVWDAWTAPVWCARRQAGCARFSFVPLNAQAPRRYQCQPRAEADATRVTPQFTSLRYGEPGYGQLSGRCAPEIFKGADDESSMGVFHALFEPQRITNAEVRLNEYLRFGLEAGLFFEPNIESCARPVAAYGYGAIDLCGHTERLPGVGASLI